MCFVIFCMEKVWRLYALGTLALCLILRYSLRMVSLSLIASGALPLDDPATARTI